MRGDILVNEWADCLGRLREARALILRDAEAFHEAATTLEQIGQTLGGEIRNGLARYEKELMELVELTGRHDLMEARRLFNVVRERRNMAVHDGVWARHVSSRLVELFIMLEEAIMTKLTLVQDIMVRSPVVVETWQKVAHARRTLLSNSFSYLPVFRQERWWLLSDLAIVNLLRGAASIAEQRQQLVKSLDEVINSGKLTVVEAKRCAPTERIDELHDKLGHEPILVIEDLGGAPRLLGIVTPFDLL